MIARSPDPIAQRVIRATGTPIPGPLSPLRFALARETRSGGYPWKGCSRTTLRLRKAPAWHRRLEEHDGGAQDECRRTTPFASRRAWSGRLLGRSSTVRRMELRPFMESDYPTLAPWFEDETVVRWMGGPDWLDTAARKATHDPATHSLFVGHDDDPVSVVSVERIPDGRAGVAMMVVPDAQGLGRGTATLAAVLDLPEFEEVPEFFAYIEIENKRSVKLVERLGFVRATEPDRCGKALFALRRDGTSLADNWEAPPLRTS